MRLNAGQFQGAICFFRAEWFSQTCRIDFNADWIRLKRMKNAGFASRREPGEADFAVLPLIVH